MYAFIKGKIIKKGENLLILENNGIGYELIVSTNTTSIMPYDNEVCLYTYLQVKEDGISLFGFNSYEEKDMFLKLISVSGVGGKTAIQILSGAKLEDLVMAIMNADLRMLKGVKGIGKKTAELICVTLREKMGSISISENEEASIVISSNEDIINEACEVLVNLGLKKVDALKLIKKQYTGLENVETLVEKSLKNMK